MAPWNPAAHPSLLVRPGSPDTPQFVDIDCTGMDLGRTIEFVVNDVLRATVPVGLAGSAQLTYIVPPGPIRNALADLTYCDGQFDDEGNVLCRIEISTGDSMELRYQP